MKIPRMRNRNATRFALVATLAAVLALTGAAASSSSAQTKQFGIENFGKVNDNYYRGAQPRGEDFAGLKKLGVKTVVDLRKDNERAAAEEAARHGLRYVNIPMTTKQAATDEQTEQFLKLVNDPANWPVYVHCKGGRHRTGEMTALFRITRDGWTAEEAYREMKRYDFEDSLFYPRVLKRFVFSYYERFAAGKAAEAGASVPSPAAAQ